MEDSCEGTHLYARRLVKPVLLHIDDLARLVVDAPRVLAVRVLGLQEGRVNVQVRQLGRE